MSIGKETGSPKLKLTLHIPVDEHNNPLDGCWYSTDYGSSDKEQNERHTERKIVHHSPASMRRRRNKLRIAWKRQMQHSNVMAELLSTVPLIL